MKKILLLTACLFALAACGESYNPAANTAHDISATPDNGKIGFLAVYGTRGSGGQHRYIVDLGKKEITAITLSNADEVLRALSLEHGTARALGSIYNVGTREYAIVEANLDTGTYKRIYTSPNPILEVAPCADGGAVFAMGKARKSGANHMVDRGLFRLGPKGEHTMLTKSAYYQLTLQNVADDCASASFAYYGRGNEKSAADKFGRTDGKTDTDVETPTTGKLPLGGDVAPSKNLMVIREGYFAKGETLLVENGTLKMKWPYDFASAASFTPDAAQAYEVKAGADVATTTLMRYDMNDFTQTPIPLAGMTVRELVLKAE